MRGYRLIPADWKASCPPSSRSRIVIQAATSQPSSRSLSPHFIAEPPVVVTSSSMTMRSPTLMVEPSMSAGLPVFLLALSPLYNNETSGSLPFDDLAMTMPVRGTAPNSRPPTAFTSLFRLIFHVSEPQSYGHTRIHHNRLHIKEMRTYTTTC